MEVHTALGPGLLERLYEDALEHELRRSGLAVDRQLPVTIDYKGLAIKGLQLDLVVERLVVVELKVVEKIHDVHKSQLLSYMRAGGFPLGLLINFNTEHLRDGIVRRINASAVSAIQSNSPSPPRPPQSPLR